MKRVWAVGVVAWFLVGVPGWAMGRGPIRGQFTVTPPAEDVLVEDAHGMRYAIPSGPKELRLSVHRANMTIRQPGSQFAVEIPVPQFKGKHVDLGNFQLVGSQFGQLYDFLGATATVRTGPYEGGTEWVSCIRHDFPGCSGRGCYGEQAVRRRFNQVARTFTMSLLEPESRALAAEFKGVLERWEENLGYTFIGPCQFLSQTLDPRYPVGSREPYPRDRRHLDELKALGLEPRAPGFRAPGT